MADSITRAECLTLESSFLIVRNSHSLSSPSRNIPNMSHSKTPTTPPPPLPPAYKHHSPPSYRRQDSSPAHDLSQAEEGCTLSFCNAHGKPENLVCLQDQGRMVDPAIVKSASPLHHRCGYRLAVGCFGSFGLPDGRA